MSHVSNLVLEILDLDVLKTACNQMGLTFVENQKTYAWYGTYLADSDVGRSTVTSGFNPEDFGKCEHAITVPGSSYEIGVVRNPSGNGYRLIYDEYGQGQSIAKHCGGTDLPRIKQSYAEARATKHVVRQGYRVTRRVLANGRVEIKAFK